MPLLPLLLGLYCSSFHSVSGRTLGATGTTGLPPIRSLRSTSLAPSSLYTFTHCASPYCGTGLGAGGGGGGGAWISNATAGAPPACAGGITLMTGCGIGTGIGGGGGAPATGVVPVKYVS